MPVNFGRTALDYARYRAGFPDRFYDRLFNGGWIAAGNSILDVGTGTGTVARGLTKRGCNVVGLDPSIELVEQAKVLDSAVHVKIDYVIATAEQTGLPSHSFDAVTAGTCWHWFDRRLAALESRRLLKPGGRLIIAHQDWLGLSGNVVEATEALIREHNPAWGEGAVYCEGNQGGTTEPLWFNDLHAAEFKDIESFTFHVDVAYSHEAWLGRIRASAGVAASMSPDQVARFSDAHRAMLAHDFRDDPLRIPHRVFAVSGCVS